MPVRTSTAPATIPSWPLWLGAAGLIPFVALAGLALAGPQAGEALAGISPGLSAKSALLGYGAVIVSFLGGIRWGAAMQDRQAARDYVLSVLPSLVAWGCLALPTTYGLGGLGLVVLALGALDQDLPARDRAPRWFGRLRIALSLGAGLSLLAGAIA